MPGKYKCFLTAAMVLPILFFNGCLVENNSPQEIKTVVKNTVQVRQSEKDPAAMWRSLDLKNYPDADTVLLDDIDQVSYNPDGTDSRSDEFWTLIVTSQGRDEMQTQTFHFNEFYQKPPVVEIRVIKPDGSVVHPELQQNISVESSQMAANIFDPAHKVLIIGIPDLEVGDIVHIKSLRESIRPRMKGIWSDIVMLQYTSPILHYSYIVSAPEELPLGGIAVKNEVAGSLKRSEKREDGRIVYTFEAVNVPQFIPEPDMPPFYMYCMRVLVSTAKEWAEISRWYYNLCEKRLQAVSPELTAAAKKLAEGKSEAAAIRALFDFVSKEIRYTGITNEDSAPGYEPHDVKDTFAQKHGVCRDKAALLAAMLREAGFDASMVLFMAGDPKDPEIPNNYFNHAITGVKTAGGELILMDPTDENSPDLLPAYGMDKSFLVARKDGDILRRTPVVPAGNNKLLIRSRGMIDKNFHLHLTGELTFKGINDNIYRSAFARWTGDYQRQFVSAAVKQALPGAELLKLTVLPEDVRDLSQDFKLIIECKVEDYVDIQWGDGVLRMPFLSSSFGALNFILNNSLLKSRKYPMCFDSTAGIDEVCHVTLPETLKNIALPVYKNNEKGALICRTNVKNQGSVLEGSRIVMLNDVEIAAADYAAFHRAVKLLADADKRQVIVQRNFNGDVIAQGAAEAKTMVEDSQMLVEYTDVDKYSYTASVKFKVLNYGGVKEFSELVLNFVEGLSQAEFIRGSVTDPDGSIRKVTPEMIQIMDDPVSEGAPRYPKAGKMIVPLPGVKVGSVIEYAYKVTYSHAEVDAFIYDLFRIAPAIRRSVEFRYPAKLQKKFTELLPQAGFEVKSNVKNGMKIITVAAENIPMRPLEPGTPPAWLYAPVAGVSTLDIASYSSTVLKAFEKAAAQNEKSSALAAELVAGMSDEVEKVKVIRNFVAKNIRSAGLELNTLGCKYITPADVTLREGYGNSVDRAVLLYAMLKAAGITKLDVVLASSLPAIEQVLEKFPLLMQNVFDSVLLRVNCGNEDFYLNDTDEYSMLGSCSHDGKLGLELADGELITISVAAGCESAENISWAIRCRDDGGAEITRQEIFYGGKFAALNRFFDRITPEAEKQFWEQQCSGVLADAEITGKKVDFSCYPGEVSITYQVPDFWVKSGDYAMFELPESLENILQAAGKRTQPYWCTGGVDVKSTYVIELPGNWSWCELAGGSFTRELPGTCGWIAMKSQMLDQRTLRVDASARWNAFYLESSAYSVLEDMQKQLTNPANRTILFKTTGK